MGGSATFQESFEARLKIINPSCETVKKFLESHSPLLTPGVKEFVNLLRSKGCDVYLVSGGIMEIIEPVAALLDIPKENVFANRLKYFYSGEFAGFDKTCPTSRSGGKPVVVEKLKKQHGYQRLVMIGDGVTDMEACPPADAFIGFGVNVQRKAVKEKSKWFALSFQEIINVLKE
uniref:Phosphoserine phosphatase n=1 Tax=Phallusia mammillata TaxID=59560 RepID=A0A6F9DW07_9ASCI|nr:phosphoserine phosphatase-like [Phallusia mammillata]